MKVLKFGGTSLASAARMKNVAEIVLQQTVLQQTVLQQGKVLVVLSAVAGTTDALVRIASLLEERVIKDNFVANSNAIAKNKVSEENQIIEQLKSHYFEYISELFSEEESKCFANSYIESQLKEISEALQKDFSPRLEAVLLAKGELISTQLFYLYLSEQKKLVKLLLSLDFLRLTRENIPDNIFLEKQLKQQIQEGAKDNIYIAQGFICRNAFGDITNLKRGGSDYSASLFAAALGCEEVQIWTDIDGMHNNDPRFVDNTQAIRELSFNEAAELAYFGAKILHPSSIKPARKNNIPVRLLNTLEPAAKGTLISTSTTRQKIKAVAAKSGITAIKVRSSDMLQAEGFLRRLFEVFELYHTSIDMITTSEVAVSVTIDDTTHLEEIIKTIEEYGQVEVDKNLAIICVVGEDIIENKTVASKVICALESLPIRMISYGGSEHNISLLIPNDSKEEALKLLHQELFNV